MPLPRGERPGERAAEGLGRLSPLRAGRGLMERLNVRLVLVLASVAAMALLVSGAALSQTLPGYFIDQAERRSFTAVLATGLLLRERVQLVTRNQPQLLQSRELRETQVFLPVARVAADELAQGTVEIYNPDGSLAARADPDPDRAAELRDQDLQPDNEVQPQRATQVVPIPGLPEIQVTIQVSQPYTNRVATLQRVTGSLIGAGLAALAISLFVGVFAARRLTAPLARLRRASSRFAQGELEERSPRFGIVEVDELAQQFNVMADRLSESVRLLQADRDRLREFVADVSHELRTPIAALRTFTELQRDGDVDPVQRREFLDRSTEQINRLEWMSTNLLDLSRIDAGIYPLDVRWGDLRDPVRSAVEAHAEQAEQRGVSLAFEVPTSPLMLRVDRERIVQLLSNLIGNALKFTPRGGEVVVTAVDDGADAVIQVADSGPGIPQDELPHVFERFFRGTNVGEARASGSGLGLAIARGIVEMHGGAIGVASAPGEGAVFTVRLPNREPPAAGDGQ